MLFLAVTLFAASGAAAARTGDIPCSIRYRG